MNQSTRVPTSRVGEAIKAKLANAGISCLSFRPLRRNTLVGFASLHWPLARLKLHGVAVHQNDNRKWCQLSARPQTGPDGNTIRDRSGKVQYSPMIEFDDSRVLDLFSDLAVEAIEAYDPSAFADPSPPPGASRSPSAAP